MQYLYCRRLEKIFTIGSPDELSSIYEQASEIQEDIVSIVLISISGDEIISSETKSISSEDLTLKQWYVDAISDASIFHFSSPHIQDIYSNSVEEVITVTKLIDYYSNMPKLIDIHRNFVFN